MPNPTPRGLLAGVVDPQDAVAAFNRRNLLQPSFRWQDVWQEEHSRALAVAGVQRLDVLQVFQDAFGAKFSDKTSLAEFRKAVMPGLVAKGFWGDAEITDPATGEKRVTRFDNSRLELIYNANVRQSYAAGQWERIQRNKARMPFIIYRTMGDERVRAEHAAWDGLVLPVDHEFWLTHFPPCGWRCRCKAFAIDQTGIDRMQAAGKKLQFKAPPVQLISYVNPRTGEIAAVPKGIDPGWAHNPGVVSRDEALHEQTLRKAWAASPLAGAGAVAQATFARQEMVTAATQQFTEWTQGIAREVTSDTFKAAAELQHVSALSPQAVRALTSAGHRPTTAVLSMWDADVAKTVAGVSDADLAVIGRLPQLLERPAEILMDGTTATVLVELLGSSQADAVLAVTIELLQAGRDGADTLNLIRAATVTTRGQLQDGQVKSVWRRG